MDGEINTEEYLHNVLIVEKIRLKSYHKIIEAYENSGLPISSDQREYLARLDVRITEAEAFVKALDRAFAGVTSEIVDWTLKSI